jgi:hypothetical protein
MINTPSQRWSSHNYYTETSEDENEVDQTPKSNEEYFSLVKDMLENNDNEFILHRGKINEYWVANYQICEEVIYKYTWNEELCEHESEEATLEECQWVLDQAEKTIEMIKEWKESRK